jgi:hypothetical protein
MTMDKLHNAKQIAHVLLSKYDRKNINAEIINQEIQNIEKLPGYEDLNKEDLQAMLEADFDVHSKDATILVAEDVKPWLYEEKSKINPELWNRYKIYMNRKDSSFPIDTVDDLTDKILDKCVNPKTKGRWDRRGMVVGNVQSGKTANYAGLINKATDAGYKLIIVIAGIHNSLRAQTQFRIDEGFIGRNSADFIRRKRNNKIGVGLIHADTEIYSYTSTENNGDFNRSTATKLNVPIGGKSPTVLVIKKNKSILENLIYWLYNYATEIEGEKKIVDVPLLVIDDEADNASVNSGNEIDVRAINRLIRTLLNLFNQNTYIGYTATPYANIYIPTSWNNEIETTVKDLQLKIGEDLFPRDFIVNIPPPSNYIGAIQVFGYENDETGESYEGLDIIRPAEDQEPWFPLQLNSRNKENLPDDVPQSLKRAVQSFILTCAIRRLRGHEKKHNSMLVHVALYVTWIDRVAWLVNELMRDYKNQIHSRQGNLINELKHLFENDFIPTTDNVLENISYKDPKIKQHSWDEVLKVLDVAVSKIEVRAVHGQKNTSHLEYHNIQDIDYNDYENGISVIAVGGNRLARGITLEGLSVSYYLRTTRLYDSLMQMGRWFGYRPGYVDLCRLFTTEQLVNWYRHVTLATEEMRADFDEMAARNKRPVDYQLKVRTHSGMLSITSLSKMREHELIQVGFSGEKIQTYQLIKDRQVVRNNYNALKVLLEQLPEPENRTTESGKLNGLFWGNINPEMIISFIESYRSDLPKIKPEIIKTYIRKQVEKDSSICWSVKLVLNSETKNKFNFKCRDKIISAGLPERSNTDNSFSKYFILSKNNILDKSDRRDDLTDLPDLTEKTINKRRSEEKKALLVIYPLNWIKDESLESDVPLVGWGLIFPKIENEVTVEYAARIVDGAEDTEIDDDNDADINE